MLVCLYVSWIESVRVKPKHRNRSIYRISQSNTATLVGEGAPSTPLHIQRIVVGPVITLSHRSQEI